VDRILARRWDFSSTAQYRPRRNKLQTFDSKHSTGWCDWRSVDHATSKKLKPADSVTTSLSTLNQTHFHSTTNDKMTENETELPVSIFPPRGHTWTRGGKVPIEPRNEPICYICSSGVDMYEQRRTRRVAPGVYSDTEIMESRRAWEERTWTLYFRMRTSPPKP